MELSIVFSNYGIKHRDPGDCAGRTGERRLKGIGSIELSGLIVCDLTCMFGCADLAVNWFAGCNLLL